MRVLGIDTSNYTTSIAVADETGYRHGRTILEVKTGERGLRQSDALFLHTVNLPRLFSELDIGKTDAVSYSEKPRDIEGSYMPCFLAGKAAATAAASAAGVPLFAFSHQAGHIMAALKSCEAGEEALGREFLAFHISGGTTELLHVKRKAVGFDVAIVGETLDINAGQLIDRAGVLLGLKFPCGMELEKLAVQGKTTKLHTCIKSGSCNLSGAENKIIQMYNFGEAAENIARYAIDFVCETILGMSRYAREAHRSLPILYAGGVMRDNIIRDRLTGEMENIYFAENELSSDNAVGTAYLGLEALKEGR
ncbi:MAG TPA: peptidase M22 [Clostridiales bacterium]|nr:peptidase M22 [Candidatus Apopatosoma intestinale]